MIRKSPPTRTLRDRPDLDQLKRQAKELLEAYRAAAADAAAEVTAHYRDADPATFALHDAQLVLARSYGFDSWPKLKACVDGVTVRRLADAVRAGDVRRVRAMLEIRPELVHMDMAADDEHRALHYAVLDRAPEMVRLLMAHGADARKGIYPHRDATSALAIASDRGDQEIVSIIEEEEQRRREATMSAPGTPAADVLCDAIEHGDRARAIAMLEADATLVNSHHRDGWTPLHAASAVLDEAMVAWLLERGADVTRRAVGRVLSDPAPADPKGPALRPTPLDMAAATRDWRAPDGATRFTTVAALLRQHGAQLTPRSAVALDEADWLRARHAERALANATVVDIFEPASGLLTIAVKHDRPEMLALLLDFGFDPDERMRLEDLEKPEYSWGMPLWHCAATGRTAMAEMLLERGADPNARVYASGSPVFRAYHEGDAAMIELLQRYGGATDAITAGMHGQRELATKMLAGEVDGHLQEGMFAGQTVAEQLLWGAADGGYPAIVRLALEQVDWPRDDARWYRMLWRPLPGHAARSDYDKYLVSMRLMLERGDANSRGSFGRTLLHDIAARGTPDEQIAFATMLLDAGARVDVRDDLLKSTPLGWACRWGRVELVKLLLDRGADPIEADAEPWATPWAWAKKRGHDEVIAMLS